MSSGYGLAMDFEEIFSKLYGGSRGGTPGSEASIYSNFEEIFINNSYSPEEKYKILGELVTHLRWALYKITDSERLTNKLDSLENENDPYPFTQEKLSEWNSFVRELHNYVTQTV